MVELNIEVTPELAAMLDELATQPRPLLSPMAQAALDRLREAVEIARAEEAARPKYTYSICPKTETGLHEWTRLPPPTRSALSAGIVIQDMNVLPVADMKCVQCGKLYSEHVTVEETDGR